MVHMGTQAWGAQYHDNEAHSRVRGGGAKSLMGAPGEGGVLGGRPGGVLTTSVAAAGDTSVKRDSYRASMRLAWTSARKRFATQPRC